MKLTAIRRKLFELACLPGVQTYFNGAAQIWVRGDIPAHLLGECYGERTDSLYGIFARAVLGRQCVSCYDLSDVIGQTNEYSTYLALNEHRSGIGRGREGRRAKWLRRLILRDLGLTEPNPSGKMD